MGRPIQRRFRDGNFLCPHILVAPVASGLGIVAKHAFPLTEVPAVKSFLVLNPPAFRRRVVFRNVRTAGHLEGQRPLPIQFGFLDLLATQGSKTQKSYD